MFLCIDGEWGAVFCGPREKKMSVGFSSSGVYVEMVFWVFFRQEASLTHFLSGIWACVLGFALRSLSGRETG